MAALGTDETLAVLESVLQILKEEHVFDTSGQHPVVEFLHPDDLQKIVDVKLREDGTAPEQLTEIVRNIVKYSVKTGNLHFHNQLYGGVDRFGLAGSLISESLNTSQYTYEVAPVFMVLEREILEKALSLLNYPAFPESDGILCPGGSIANMYGMVLARHSKMPQVKIKGLSGLPPPALFTNECGHYSMLKGAHWLGIGTDGVYNVKTDDLGRMDPQDLRRAIKKSRTDGFLPFFVNATAGTTVLGSIDPLDEIAKICEEEKLWLHVDACLGGTLLLSGKYRDRLRGIEKSNSVAWNPHKMLGTPIQCSLFLVKGKNVLHEANCANATYLFQQDKFYDVSWDTGDKSIQCGRKVDAMKLWLMWRARGSKGLEESVNVAMEAADYFFQKIKSRNGFRLVLPKFEGNTISFWYIPPSMRNEKENADWWKKLHDITRKIKELLVLDGKLMIGYTPMSQKNLGNFFRMVVCCQPPPTRQSMDYAVEQIEKVADNL